MTKTDKTQFTARELEIMTELLSTARAQLCREGKFRTEEQYELARLDHKVMAIRAGEAATDAGLRR